jgi:hypothetical protein
MTRTDARAIVALKVFVERNQIVPIWISLKLCYRTEHRTLLIPIAQADSRKPPIALSWSAFQVDVENTLANCPARLPLQSPDEATSYCASLVYIVG